MFVLHRAFVLCPGEIPAELGTGYTAACQVLGLDPDPVGYAVYLIDTMAGRCTLISRDLTRLRAALDAGGGDQRQPMLLALDQEEITEQPGWPEQLGGTPWCQFCRSPRPAWAYDGPDVDVLLAAPALAGLPPEVAGAEITGRTDWLACEDCHALIESGDYHALWQRCVPYSEPMPVQAAWLQFWDDRGPARPHNPPELITAPSLVYVTRDGWNPACRKRMARELASAWNIPVPVAPFSHDDANIDLRPYREHLEPLIASSITEAWSFASAATPPPGAVTSRRVHASARLITASGRGWSLVARTDGPAVMMHDHVPFTAIDITRDPRLPGLLNGITAAAARSHR